MEEQRRAALDREDRALAAPKRPRKPTELDIASSQKLEWDRIAGIMTEQQMALYSPDEDPRVARPEDQCAQRKATEAAWGERSGDRLPVEVLRHRVYRATARATAPTAGEEVLVRHVFAASGGAAIEHDRSMFARPGSTYQDVEYRIISIAQVLPEPGEFF
ncbi:hypothetical protein ABT096_32395 [Streptomyces sp. NPDC002561]|uniref:hypothetical protein n=1 Tax=Streptomyces sp. NPDC002561 TaxID=3154418 RepID=UPI003326053A